MPQIALIVIQTITITVWMKRYRAVPKNRAMLSAAVPTASEEIRGARRPRGAFG